MGYILNPSGRYILACLDDANLYRLIFKSYFGSRKRECRRTKDAGGRPAGIRHRGTASPPVLSGVAPGFFWGVFGELVGFYYLCKKCSYGTS